MASPLGLIAPSLAPRRTRPAGEVTTPLVTRAVVVTGVPDGWEPATRGDVTVNAITVVGRTAGRRNLQVSITARLPPGTHAWVPFADPSGATYSQPAGASQGAVVWSGPQAATAGVPAGDGGVDPAPDVQPPRPQPAPVFGTIELYGLLPTDGVTLDGVTATPTMDGAVARLTRVSSGVHSLRVVRQGLLPFVQQVNVTPPTTAMVHLAFEQPPPPASDTFAWVAVIAGIGGAVWWASKRA